MLERIHASATAAVRRADLVYVNDGGQGYTRRRAGKGFTYLDGKGRRVADADTVARIRSLAIPPAWEDVWISGEPTGHIQATGRDQRGRKQYRYHPAWTECRDEAKFSNLAPFARALPKLRRRVDADLRRRGFPRERVVAAVVWLLDNTLIRIGNPVYAQENSSFGLTTLRTRHLEIGGSSLCFSFRGKSGQEWNLKLTDRRIARIVRDIQELPGQHLFQYVDEDGARHAISSNDVNDYIHESIGPEYSSKHFRTWGATVSAAMAFADEHLPDSKRNRAIALNAVIDGVAGKLRNTRAVCRRCYVHPAIVDAWLEGRLGEQIGLIRRRCGRPLSGLDRDESLVLRWLEAEGA